jgi:hypothetical protein
MEVRQYLRDRGWEAHVKDQRYLGTAGVPAARQWHGVYMAKVVNVMDPLQAKRIKMRVPQVLGTAISNWAPPVFNPNLAVPAVGTLVNAVFQGGDINAPLYYPPFRVPVTGDWQLITPLNGWANVAGLIKLQARTTTSSAVEIVGNLSGGTVTDNTIIGTLPAGYFSATAGHYFPCEAVAGAATVSNPVTTGFTSATSGVLTDLTGSLNNIHGGVDSGTQIPTGNFTITSGSLPFQFGPGGQQFSNNAGASTITLTSGALTLNNGNVNVSGASVGAQTTTIDYNTPCIKIDTSGNLRVFNLNSHVSQISFTCPSIPLNTL